MIRNRLNSRYLIKDLKKGFVLFISSMFLLSACNNGDKTSSVETQDKIQGEKSFRIGVMQIVQHPSLDAAFEGFKKALKDSGVKVKYTVQNAQGDMNNNNIIAKNFAADKVDLIFANSTQSAQAALNVTKDIPIIFTSVADPVASKLVKSLQETTGNITGTTDNHPEAIPKMIKFIQRFKGNRIGMIYNAGEQNSVAQVNLVRKAIEGTHLKIVTATVSSTSEVKQAAQSLVNRADFFYVVTDNVVVSAIESVVSVANEEKMPLFTGEQDSIKRGAFASYGFDYRDIGYEAGEMAAQVLKYSRKISELPVQYPKKLKLLINKSTAKKLGITLNPNWEKNAEYIE